jgi:hypothetical protein
VATQVADTRVTPPYVPIKTFLNFIDSIKDTVPHRIDNSVLTKYSGSVRTQLRGALRFLGLIDDVGITQPALRELAAARGTSEWKRVFTDHFFAPYKEILGQLNLERGTLQQLKERFRAVGLDGSVMIKSVRFFLAGLEETGSTYSPHFKARGLSTGVGSARPKRGKTRPSNGAAAGGTAPRDESTADEEAIPAPEGSQRFTLPVKDKSPALMFLPADMKQPEWEMLDSYVRMYFGYKREGQTVERSTP